MDERAVTGWWRTSLVRIEPGEIALRGYPIEQLIGAVTFPQTIWLLLKGELPSREQAALLEAALVAAVDHGPQAPSIAAARMAATCGLGLNNAVATGVNLLGDVHGGAGQQAMAMYEEIRSSELPLADAVRDYRSRHRYLPGFGHRFHPRDPRRDPLLGLVRAAVADGTVGGEYLAVAEEIERQLGPVPMNIDGATAVIYAELGFPPELGRGLFVLSRSVGILAHAWEEKQSGTRIKGPLPRPLLPTYTGPALRDL
ncbi:citryl-CoA lyase [Lentzea sp. NBRC 105346]|uniref:citryl-CoA lyase n=1 Tax=Lentzea sp. NBRC 105346 TaxID=3032205 RepID=UPI0024A30B6B|nr:citryl-CoA lyase [Lentzea sp. NBRC 105346]GLZ31893.1 citryl-CoA lyase [Lentzea sp. NBRC 105346]